MRYDPDKHHRRSVRLKGHDYAQPGAYFVTVCTYQRECLFGHVVNGEMRLNDAGEIARRCWEDIPDHFPLVELDAFVIMPNHVHGIILITESCTGEKSFAPTFAPTTTTAPQSPSRTIGSIVRGSEIVIPCKGEACDFGRCFAPTDTFLAGRHRPRLRYRQSARERTVKSTRVQGSSNLERVTRFETATLSSQSKGSCSRVCRGFPD